MFQTMLSYHFKWRKNKESKKPNDIKMTNGRIMALSNCVVCSSEKLKVFKEQEAKWLLTIVDKIPLSGP